jgi:SAM-dependent methyltransferase
VRKTMPGLSVAAWFEPGFQSEPKMPYYDHNAHYGRLLLQAIPNGCRNALDVGCGNGHLVRRIAEQTGTNVVGIDADARMVETARGAISDSRVEFIEADFMSFHPDRKFDFICSVASIHHLPFEQALQKMTALLHPNGVLAVLGLYRETGPVDTAFASLAEPVNALYSLRSNNVTSNAPTRPPQMTLREIRATSNGLLASSRVRRLLLWRYLLTWTAPEMVNSLGAQP